MFLYKVGVNRRGRLDNGQGRLDVIDGPTLETFLERHF
jgi:hypothetical protein